MQAEQAKGIDTRRMMPVYAGIFGVVCQLFLPWISMPMLKYCRVATTYRIFQMDAFVDHLQQCAQSSQRIQMQPFTEQELALFRNAGEAVQFMGLGIALLMMIEVVAVFVKRGKCVGLVRTVCAVQFSWTAVQLALSLAANVWVNDHMGRQNTFENLTIHSQIQLTSWVYAQMFLAVLLLGFAPRLLCPDLQSKLRPLQARKTRVGRRTLAALWMIVLGIPATILFGIYFLNDRSSVFIGCCIVCLSMLPFAMVFEDRRPQARELLLIAVMAAIAVVGRAAFFMIPQFKPTVAVVIIAGASLGPEAGFLTGAVAAFVSNFFFGQGPWTPWQMFAMGIIGFLAGLLFSNRKKPVNRTLHLLLLSGFGGAAVFGIYGFLMDVSSIITASQSITKELVIARILSGLPFNLVHAVATVFFLAILSDPMERKIHRIRKKYGLLQT